MGLSYDKLWKLLIDKKMNKTELKKLSGISFNVLARMGKNEAVSLNSIEKICRVLSCNIGDIMVIAEDVDSIKTLKTIELFAGAGGLALGIEKAGFETLGLIEFDKHAADTLKCNRPKWRVINEDIGNISGLNLEEFFNLKKGELDLL
ncbi:MAG: helix-turn-helix domain-containing protein, partial [Clostridiales bacterium]